MAENREMRIAVEGAGEVLAVLMRPADARWMLVLAHGAGAGMKHAFMEALAEELARVEVATLRYQFPYMEEGRGVPDRPKVLTATVAAADHSFQGLKKSGRSDQEVLRELAETTASWVERIAG